MSPAQWKQRLIERGLGARSRKEYARVIVEAERYFAEGGWTLRNVPAHAIEDFALTKPPTWSSRKAIRSALKHAFALVGRRNPPLGAVKVPPKPRMVCRALSEQQAERLAAEARVAAAAAVQDPASRIALRQRQAKAILLGMYPALRREEIAKMRFDDLWSDGERWWLRVFGKGGVQADVPMRAGLAEMFLADRNGSPYVFPGLKGGHVAPATVWHWTRRFATSVGLYVTPHQLRHTALATANDATGDLRSVQTFARHARPDTTAGYTRTTARRLIGVADAVRYGEE